MTGRRRLATRRTATVEPANELPPRQTRSSTKRPEASTAPEFRTEAEIPQRGTQRRRRRSVESVATNDFSKSSSSPEPENRGLSPVSESIEIQTSAISEVDDAREPLELDPDRIKDMLDFDIPKLARCSGRMYEFFSVGSNQPNTDDWKRVRKSHNSACLPFVGSNALFINPINLPKNSDPEAQAKIHGAICSGNLMSLVANIMDVKFRSKGPQQLLEQLHHSFPTLFSPNCDADMNDREETLNLAIYIRCRHLVELLAANPFSKPVEIAAKIFCNQSVRDSSHAREILSKGPYSKLNGIDANQSVLDDYIYQEIIQRDLVPKLTSDDRLEIQSSLDQEWPQERLFDELSDWALEMYQALNKPTNPGSARGPSPTLDSHARSGPEESESLFVHENDEVGEDSDLASDTETEGYDKLPSKESNQSFIKSTAALAAVRQSEREDTQPSNQQAVKGKDKVLETREAISRLDPGQLVSLLQKRARPSEDGEDEEDDDFEVNEQLRGESRRVRDKNTTTRRPSPKRTRFSKEPQAGSSQPLSPRIATARRATRERPHDALLDDPNLQKQDIFALSQGAQNIRRAIIASKPRQVRKAWSSSDTSRLLDLIADPSLNCSWSKMQESGGFEETRNQQALRDKARNLKVLYLESDKVLPPGFDQVVLGQKEKNAVTKCGRNPDRREDELDEEGEVINNIWVGAV